MGGGGGPSPWSFVPFISVKQDHGACLDIKKTEFFWDVNVLRNKF